jgi:ADP-heptose:LPS heptosyltransferase
MNQVFINYKCRHYVGSKPCSFNKLDGSECADCQHASEFHERVLWIKLDAIGDVLRSASMLPLLKELHPGSYVAWVTKAESVDLVRMMAGVDEVIPLSELGLARLATGEWDHVYSLSNDVASASLASMAAKKRTTVGFHIDGGVVRPTNAAAERWLEMAVFDRVKRSNSESYQRLMADIIGVNGRIAPPVLVVAPPLRDAASARAAELFGTERRRRVAVNVGSGARWPKKMIDAVQIARCCTLLRQELDVDVMLVGGAAEADKTTAILDLCGADQRIREFLTTSSIPEFVATLMQADALLCGDTLALHIGAAIGLPTVAVFGPTSQAEIADFDGLIAKTWVDSLDCLCCYGDCNKRDNCMSLLDAGRLVQLVASQLERPSSPRPPLARIQVSNTGP